MVGRFPRLSKRAWTRIALWTGATTLALCGISVTVAAVVMKNTGGTLHGEGLITAALLPFLMTPPIMVPLLTRHHELERTNSELRELAFQDSLLDCMNRRGFTAATDLALQHASAYRPCALLIIDADNFKRVNDRFGHELGDEALRIIAETIKSTIRSADILGRIGGEEFGVYLPGTDDASARASAERIRKAVSAATFAPEGERYKLSVSIGGAVATEASGFAKLYREADHHLYAAKKEGRNRAQFDPFTERHAAAEADDSAVA